MEEGKNGRLVNVMVNKNIKCRRVLREKLRKYDW